MVSAVALFVIVAVPIIVGFGISAYLFVYRRTRSCSDASDHSALPLHSPQKPGSFRHLDTIRLLPPLTVPPRACRRSSRPPPPLFQSSASSYVTLSSFPPLLPTAAAPERRQVADINHPSRHHASAEDDDASLDLHYWPQTPSTASQSSNAFSPTSSPENSTLVNYHQGMRQAAFTALRRSTQTPALDFASLPTFDISSGTPPNLGVGPSNPVPLPRPNSSSSSTMVSTLPARSPYENPFANPPPSQQLDYFNCKPLPVPSSQLEQHPYRCKVSSPLSAAPRSHWSPAVTPAPLQVLTRSSSPVLSSAGITPDDTGNLFPYISYESSSAPTPAPDPILPLPTPPPSSATASFPSAIATSNLVDIKIYFSATHDLIKIRLPGSASLEDLKSKAAERMSGGCKSLLVAKAGVDTRDPSDVAKADLDELGGERQWRTWLEAITRADRRSGAGKQRRIVLWAM